MQKDCTTLCCAVYYTRYLPSGCEPPREAAQTCFLWIVTLLKVLAHQHETLAEQNRQALAKHREHNKLVKLAANMSQDDYEHAGVDKLEDEIAAAKQLRKTLETTMTWVKAELGEKSLPTCLQALLCFTPNASLCMLRRNCFLKSPSSFIQAQLSLLLLQHVRSLPYLCCN